MTIRLPILIITAALIIVADQISKNWILDLIAETGPFQVTEFFNIVLVWNDGVSFGMFQNFGETGRWILFGFAIIASVAAAIYSIYEKRPFSRLALWLIVAGALGNAIDRYFYGAVVDFLDFHLYGYHWPAFNVADSSIVIGAFIFILDGMAGSAKKEQHSG